MEYVGIEKIGKSELIKCCLETKDALGVYYESK